jgi:hypothetical protein
MKVEIERKRIKEVEFLLKTNRWSSKNRFVLMERSRHEPYKFIGFLFSFFLIIFI